MTQQLIDIGVQGNDGTGDSIRASFNKVNANFTELYAIFGGGGTLKFTNLADAPATYAANQLIMANTTGGGLSARTIKVGASTGAFTIDTSNPNEIIFSPPTSNLQADQNPTLGGSLNAVNAFSIVNLVDPSETLVAAFNANAYNVANNITTTLSSLAVTVGYADDHYLQVSNGQIIGALNVRSEPLTPQLGVAGYDSSLSGNYLATEAVQRKDLVLRQGDTMTGVLTLSDHPTPLSGDGIVQSPADLQAATKYYVDNNTYYSGVNLYVTTKGDDLQTNTPPGREGRAWQYAYATVGAAALQAYNLINLSALEPGPYRQTIAYTIGPNQFNSIVTNAGVSPLPGYRVGLVQGSSQVQGYTDAADLLQYNRSFIQAETIAYLNKKYVNKFVFDQTRWSTFVEEIIQGVAYDLALNSTHNVTTQATNFFYSYNIDVINNNLTQIQDAVTQIRNQILNYSYNYNSSSSLQNYITRIIYALCYDFALGSNYQSTFAGLYFPYANSSTTNTIPDFSAEEIVNLLDTTSIAITSATGTGTIATIQFAEQSTAPFAVGEQVIVAGVSTVGYNSTSGNTGGNGYWTVINTGTTYVTFACTTAGTGSGGTIVRNNLINNIINDINNPSITTSLQTNAALISELVLTSGANLKPPMPTYPASAYTTTGLVSAGQLLLNNISFIQAEITGFLTSKFSSLDYNKTLSKRDIEFTVYALVYDLTYGGNSQSTYAGVRYWGPNGSTPYLTQGQESTACIAALNYVATLALDIINNQVPAILYQNTIFQYTNETYQGGSAAASSITANINTIVNIINNGTSGYTFNTTNNTNIGVYGTAPTLPASGNLLTAFQLITNVSGGNVATLTTTAVGSNGYLSSVNGFIDKTLLGAPSDNPATQNTIYAKFNVILKMLTYGLTARPQIPLYTDTAVSASNAARKVLVANMSNGFLASNINNYIIDYIATNSLDITFNHASSLRDIETILEAICYDINYGGNSATVYAASQYWHNGTLQLATNQNSATLASGICYKAILELENEVIALINNSSVTVYSGNNLNPATWQSAWAPASGAATSIRTLFGLLLDVIANYQSVSSTEITTVTNSYVIQYPSLTNYTGILFNTVQPLGAWNIITNAESSITNYVINYLTTTYTGGLTYNESLCYRDLGLIIDAITIDLVTGTPELPSTYQTINAGNAFYRNTSAIATISAPILSPSVDGIGFAKNLAAQVLNQTTQLRYQTTVVQNSYTNNLTASGVQITGTSGQFSCNATTLAVGQTVIISGSISGTGSISGYTTGTTYLVSATNGTTTFTLTTTSGLSLVTTAGTPTGLSYTLGSIFYVDSTKLTVASDSTGNFGNAVNQVNSSYNTILNIINYGLSAASAETFGSGYYSIQVSNGGQGSVDQGQSSDDHIIPGKILVGNTSGANGVILSYSPGGSLTYDTINVNMLQPGFFIPGETLSYAESVSIQHITIRVESGIYYEDYPIRMAPNVTIKGDDFRRTLIRPIDRVSKSPWISLFFHRDGIFDGMQIGLIDYSSDYSTTANSSISLSGTTGNITATLTTGQIPSSWNGLVLTEATYIVTSGTVATVQGKQLVTLTFVAQPGSTMPLTPYTTGSNIIVSGMTPTTYNGTFTVSTCNVTSNVATVVFENDAVSTLTSSGSANSATNYGNISTGKAVITAVSGNVMNLTVIYPFSTAGTFTFSNWHLYTTINYGRHYLTNPLDINSTPKNNKDVDVFLVNDATRISNITAQGHGGFMMVLDPEGQIKSKSPYAQEAASFAGSINAKRFAGGQLIDGMAGRLAGTVVYVDSYPPNAVGLGYVNGGTTLTITGLSGGTFSIGMTVSGLGIGNSPTIVSQISGTTGGAGAYQLSSVQTTTNAPTPVTITGIDGTANCLITVQGVVNSGLDVRPPQAPCSFYLEGFRYQIDQVYDWYANVTVGTVTYASGASVGGYTLTVNSVANIQVGQYISGTGIPSDATPSIYISAINKSTNTITLSNTNFINGVVWTGLTAVPSSNATYTIGAPQARLILDPSTPFTALSDYLSLQNSLSGGNYFQNILQAVVNDAVLGTNFQSARTGLIYIQSQNVTSGLTTVLLDLGINYISSLIKNAIPNDTTTSGYVASNVALVYSIINNGITALPNSVTYTAPTTIYSGVTYTLQDVKNAANLLQLNRAFIQQEVTAWLTSLTAFSLQTTPGWSPLIAQENIGYIVDAITYDILYGGNSQTNNVSTQYFWWTDGTNYYNLLTGPTVKTPTSSTNAILNVYITAFAYLQSVIANVVKGTTSGTVTTSVNGSNVTTTYPSAGNGVGQVTTLLSAGSGSGGYAPSALVTQTNNIIALMSAYWSVSNSNRNSWTTYASTNLTAITGPTLSHGANYVSGSYSTISGDYTTWLNTTIPTYLENGNVPINIEMGGNKSMLANDFTQVNDLSYGIVATNASFTEQVSTFTYYNHVGYWALNGAQVRSVAGANAYGDYGLRSTGADSTELPNAVNLVHDLVQTARVYKQGAYATAMTPSASQVALNVYIIGYEYIPYSNCYLDIDHTVEGGSITSYQINGISHTSVTIGQNVLQLTISTSTGLQYPLRDGQMVTIRTNTYVEFTNITNVKPVRPSTALQYDANLSSIYRVLSYNLSQATGEPMATATNAILQTANGFAYYTFTTDTANIINVDPVTIPAGQSSLVTATVASATLGGNTIVVSNVVGTIAVGQVVGGAVGTTGVQAGQAIGYITPNGLTVINISGTTITLSGNISSTISPTGTLVFSTLTQGATTGDNKVAIATITDVPTINQINTGIYALAWNGRTHQVLSYTQPLYAGYGNVYTISGSGSSTQLTVNNVSGSIYAGQLITGTGVTSGTYITSVISNGVGVGQSTLEYTVYLNQTMTIGSSPVGTPLQFGFNVNGYLQLSATPIYNNSSVGTGVAGLSYQSSALEAGSTTAEIVTYTAPYSPSGSLPPVDSSLKISGYSSTTAITGYISNATGSSTAGTVLTVVSIQGTGTESVIAPGMVITGSGISTNTTIVSNLTQGTLGVGSTWTVSISQAAGYNSGLGEALTLTDTSYDGTYQVTNLVNTTTISTNTVSNLTVGMVVSILQTTGYVSSISGSTLTLTIVSGPSTFYRGQIITFSSSTYDNSSGFGGIVPSSTSTYYVVNPSVGSNQISVTPTIANVGTEYAAGTAASFAGASNGAVSFTASITSSGVMTVSSSVTGGSILVGMQIFATGITAGTYVVSQTSGTSGAGGGAVYQLSTTQSIATITATVYAAVLSFTTAGGNVPAGTIVQSINTLTNTFIVSPACWIPNGATISCIQYAYVTKVDIVNAGGGYTTAPTLTFSGGGSGATQAIAAVTLKTDGSGQIQSVTVVDGGQGYTSAPVISISAVTGTVTGTVSGTNLISVNSTSGLSSGSIINFIGTAFSSTVYAPTFYGYISGNTLYITSAGSATIYQGMTIVSGSSISASTVITGSTSAVFTATISSTTMTVSAVTSGTITVGMILSGSNISPATYIVSGSGTTWTVSTAQTISTGTSITGTTYTVNNNQTAGTRSAPLTIIGSIGGLSASQTYVVNQVTGTSLISVYIYGSTTSPILGTASNITTGTLTFSLPGAAQLTAEISQFANTSVTTTGGVSSTQLSVLYPNSAGVNGSISQTSTTGNLITISSNAGTNGLTIGQQIIFTGTAIGTITPGATYYILTIPSSTTITVASSYYNYVTSTVFVPSLTVTSAGSMAFYCPNFVNQYAGTTVSSYSTKSVSVSGAYLVTLSLSGNISITNGAYYSITNNSNGLYNGIWQTTSNTNSGTSTIVLAYSFDPGIWDSGALSLASGSVTSNVATVNFTTAQSSAPYQAGQKVTITSANVSTYNGIWTVTSCTTAYVTFALVGSPSALTSGYITSTTNIFQVMSSGTGSAIGISKPFSLTNSTNLYAGYTANTNGQITQRISLTRVTGHDFNQIGTGGYNTSNVPTQIYGNPSLPADATKQVLEEGVGRVFYVSTDENGIFRVGSFFTVDQGTGTVSISQNIALTNVSGLQFQRGVLVTDFSSDAKMTENAADIVPVQSAIRSFIDYRLGLDYGGSVVPNYELIGPGYMALSGQLAMSGQMNMGGNGIINMNMPVQTAPTNAVNLGYTTTALFNQNSLFKLADGEYLPYATANNVSWSGVGYTITCTVTGTNLSNLGAGITAGMAMYGGGTVTSNGVTTPAFDGSQIVEYVSTSTTTTSAGSTTVATITLNKVPNFVPGGVVYFTSIPTGAQLVFDAPTQTWQAAQLALPNNSSPISITNITASAGVVTLSFSTQSSVPYNAGQTIVVSGVLPATYNGIYTVLASPTPTTTSVSFSSGISSAYVSGGTIIGNTIGETYTSPITATFEGYIQSNNLYIISGSIVGTISKGMTLIGSSGTTSSVAVGTIIGNGSGLVWPVTSQTNVGSSVNPIEMIATTGSYSLSTSINSGVIVDSMISGTADIEQSKLLLNVPGASYSTNVYGANGTVISTVTNGTTLAAYPTGTRQQIQAANGLASFNSAVFTQTNGWVDLETATSTTTGVQLNKITYIPTGTIPYNRTSGQASPTAVSVTTIITDGNAVTNDKFTGTTTTLNNLGVMTVAASSNATNGTGATVTGLGNTYVVLPISNPVNNPHGTSSIIQSDSTGTVDVGLLKVQGYPIITTNSGNTNYQITFGFPGATSATNTATFTGSISGTALTISSSVTGGSIMIGMLVTGSGVTASTVITGGSGTAWTVYPSQTVSSTTLTATVSPSGTPGFMTVGVNASNAILTQFFGEAYAPVLAAQTFAGAYAGSTTTSPPTISSGLNTWTVSASSGVTLTSSTPFNVGTSGGGGAATNLYGTLTVAGNTVVNSNLTVNGSTNSNTELFTVTNGTSSTVITNSGSFAAYNGSVATAFSVDSSNGNTFIGGTLQVGTTANAVYFTIDNSGNVVVRGNLTVTGVTTTTLAETVTTQSVTSTADATSATPATSPSVNGAFQVAGGAMVAKSFWIGTTLSVGSTATIGGNTSITGSSTFSVGTGASTMGGTLGVSGIVSFTNTATGTSAGTGALNVTGSTVLSNNVTLIGGSGKTFLINSGGGSPTNLFSVDANTGNTVVVSSATFTTANIYANGGTGSGGYTGTLKGRWSLPSDGTSYFDATNGTLYSGTLNASNASGSNGTITGNWTITGTTTLSSSLTLNGSTTSLAKPFTITNGGSPAVTKFLVDSANGNTTIAGTLATGGNITVNSGNGAVIGNLHGNVYSTDGSTLLVDATNNIIDANLDMSKASTGNLAISHGGTGSSTASGALSSLFAAGISGTPSTGMVITYTGGGYTWGYPTGTTIPPSGTTISSSRYTFVVGTTSSYSYNGPSKFSTPLYKPGYNQLKIYIDGVRQDGDSDYSEDSSGLFFTFTTATSSGDTVLVEVDGYTNLSLSAINTSFSPAGNIVAVDVQNALAFVDGDKLRLSGGTLTGNVSMSGSVSLNLAPGSASTAPLVFTSGTLKSSATAGSIEFSGGNMYYTDTGNTRRTFASTDYVNNAVSTGTASSVPFTGITGKPTTIAGYGITDAITTSNISSQSVSYASSAGSATSATSASSATNATNATNASNARYVYDNGDYSSSPGYKEASHVYVGFASLSGSTQTLNSTSSYSCASFGVSGSITAGGDITAYYTSDARLKTNLEPIANAVLKVNKLSGITFEWNDIAIAQGKEADVREVGLIAQEVQAVLPEAVTERDNGYLAVRYEKVVPLLVEAIKEQQATIERQQSQIDTLMKKLGM